MDESQLYEMNQRFDERLNEIASLKGQNTQFFTSESYAEMIKKVKSAKSKTSNKVPQDYQRLRKFDIITIGGIEKLIVPVKEDNTIRYYVSNNEIFHILHGIHLKLGHGGRTRMEKELNSGYKNITREMIVIYLNLCDNCKKKGFPKKGLEVEPTVSEINERCLVNLLDMQSQGDERYNFILVYQDHLTQFVQLRPLKTNAVKEIAHVLLDIFTIFGAPSILQSDNGRDFARQIVEEACNMWPELKIVHGEAKHSQSQGSVDLVEELKKNLGKWLEDNNTSQWSDGLRFVQLMKNNSHHAGMNCSPHQAMFGTKLKLGLKSTSIPHDALPFLNSEEDLENYQLGAPSLKRFKQSPSHGDENDHVESMEADHEKPTDNLLNLSNLKREPLDSSPTQYEMALWKQNVTIKIENN